MEETSKKVRHTAHTSGQWEVSQYTDAGGIDQFTVRTVAGSRIADVFPLALAAKANARLIASAPQLLEALEIAQQYVNVFILRGEDPLVGDQIKDHSFKIIEAIKLAKGNGES